MKIHLKIKIGRIDCSHPDEEVVYLSIQWVDELGDIRKEKQYQLFPDDILEFKKFTREFYF
jgi:hypothetical protein